MKLLIGLAHTLGLLGVVTLAFFDSSLLWALPGINDIVLISFVASKGSWVWAIIAVAGATTGSVFGALMTYRIGHRGGRELLYRRFPSGLLQRVLGWTQHFGALPVGVAAMLPPPCPYAPFVISAGVVQVQRSRFAASVGVGRGIRYLLEAELAMEFGRHVLSHLHSFYWSALKGSAVVLIALAASWALYRYWSATRMRKRAATGDR